MNQFELVEFTLFFYFYDADRVILITTVMYQFYKLPASISPHKFVQF